MQLPRLDEAVKTANSALLVEEEERTRVREGETEAVPFKTVAITAAAVQAGTLETEVLAELFLEQAFLFNLPQEQVAAVVEIAAPPIAIKAAVSDY